MQRPTGSGTPSGKVKKLVIKNFKDKPKLPEDFEERTWEKLQAAIHAIHAKQPIEHSLEELYRACENLCFHGMQQSLYDRLQQECEAHVKEELSRLLQRANQGFLGFLDYADRCWQDHTSQMIMIRSIFLFLDRTYVLQISGLPALWDMGLLLFRKHILSHAEVKQKMIEGILTLISNERRGEVVDRALLKSLVRMFCDLQLYPDLEKPFLKMTEQYYREEGLRLIQEMEVPTFLEHVEKRLKEEAEKVNLYLDSGTRRPLISQVEQQLLAPHVNVILEKGYCSLADDNRYTDLSRLYSLLTRVEGLLLLKATFGVYIKNKGSEIVVGGGERDKTMVQELIDFREKIDAIVEKSFQNNPQFIYCEKESFENFINIRQNKPAELIAKFIDEKLKAGNKGTTDEELEQALDKALVLFKFIQGKDVFEAFYKKDLAKRLLLSKSASVDAEKLMLLKLKSECGSGFTGNLEGMFKDIEISKDIMNAFNSNARIKSVMKGFELYVNILTASFWPTYAPDKVILPPEMGTYQEVFRKFYLTQHSGRNLMWQNSLGTCVLKAFFPGPGVSIPLSFFLFLFLLLLFSFFSLSFSLFLLLLTPLLSQGKKELSVSLYQAIILLLFNDVAQESFSFSDIKNQTNIEPEELKRTLQSLACGKVRILNKSPKGKDIGEKDEFSFNSAFKHPLTRIKVNAIQLKETEEEQKDTEERVFLDRQFQVDAAIVRIMKTRKKLSHTLLISELYNQLKFPASPADLKKRIESLIDREYLERDQTNAAEYHYLA